MSQSPPQHHEHALADVQQIAHALRRVQRDAKKLLWHDERPWQVDSHIWVEGPLPVVDLHDLSVKLAKRAVEQVWRLKLASGAVCFITGVGNNSIGPPKLKEAVGGMLARACAEKEAWTSRADGPGRYVLITDADRAPVEVQSSLPVGFWVLAVLILGAIAFAFVYNAM
jgi:hypothetical protein